MTQLPKIEYLTFLRRYFVHKFQDGKGRDCVPSYFEIWDKMFS